MSIGIGQIVVIIIVVLLLFGKMPSLTKDIMNGISNVRSLLISSSSHKNTDNEKKEDTKSNIEQTNQKNKKDSSDTFRE